MNRFAKTKREHPLVKQLLLPVVLFAAAVILVSGGLQSISTTASAEQIKSTHQAVTRAAVHCYAVEGAYPPDLAYLEDRYGLLIDHDRYVVDYVCFASNLMPDITVISLGEPV